MLILCFSSSLVQSPIDPKEVWPGLSGGENERNLT